MALATLSIDLVAKLANLETGLERAARIAEQRAKRIERAFRGIGVALGSLGVGLSIRTAVDAISKLVDEADSLGKLSQKTGIAVEQLGELQFAAKLSDVSVEELDKSLARLSRTMAEAAGGQARQAAAFKALGISVVDASGNLRPTEVVLGEIADRFQSFKDGPAKAAIAIELFGRAGADLIPLLNLGSEGLRKAGGEARRFGLITTETAKQSEQINDNITRLLAAFKGLAVDALAPSIQGLADFSDGLVKIVGSAESTATKVVDAFSLIADTPVFRALFNVGGLPSAAAGLVASASNKFAPSTPEERRSSGSVTFGDAISRRGGVAAKKDAPVISTEVGKARKDTSLGAEQIARLQFEAEEQAAKDSAEAWDFWGRQRLEQSQERADAEKLQQQQVLEFIDEQNQRAIDEGAILLQERVDAMSEFALQAQRNIQDALGSTLKDTLSGDFDSILDKWKGLLVDMAAQAVASKIGEFLFGSPGAGGGGGGLSGLFAGFFADGGTIPPGKFGVVGEAGPEIIQGGRSGVGVSPIGQSRGATIINVAAGPTRSEVLAAIQAAMQASRAETTLALRRAGVA